jgi:hypothetical protein
LTLKHCLKSGAALLDDPHYVKALQRRATSNEAVGSWSSLTSAQEGWRNHLDILLTRMIFSIVDYNTLISLLPALSTQVSDINDTLRSLKPRIEAAQKREMDEMVGKLKELGNSFLGTNQLPLYLYCLC